MDELADQLTDLTQLFIIALVFGLIGTAIGQARGRAGAGFLYGFLLGPLGWLILILGPNPKKQKEEEEKRNQEQTMLRIQTQHLAELKAIRESMSPKLASQSLIKEDLYWVRVKERELGPIGKIEIMELFSSGKIGLESQVALDTETGSRIYRTLADEIPTLKSIGRVT